MITMEGLYLTPRRSEKNAIHFSPVDQEITTYYNRVRKAG